MIRLRLGNSLLVSVSDEVRRTTSPRQVSTFPPGKYNFLFRIMFFSVRVLRELGRYDLVQVINYTCFSRGVMIVISLLNELYYFVSVYGPEREYVVYITSPKEVFLRDGPLEKLWGAKYKQNWPSRHFAQNSRRHAGKHTVRRTLVL